MARLFLVIIFMFSSFQIGAFEASDSTSSDSGSKSGNIIEISEQAFHAFYERIPNWRELLKQGIMVGIAEVALGDYLESIKDDEGAKTFVRDIGLAPAIMANVWSSEQVAGLNYAYDRSHYVAHGSKILLKVGGGFFLASFTPLNTKEAFVLSGYLGDTSGRLFINAGRFYQDHPESKDLYAYFSGFFSAATQVVPNAAIMNKLANTLQGKYKFSATIKKITTSKLNYFSNSFPVDSSKTLSKNIKSISSSNPAASPIKTLLIIFAKLTVATGISKAASTYVLSPIGNSVMDSLKGATQFLTNFQETMFYALDEHEDEDL